MCEPGLLMETMLVKDKFLLSWLDPNFVFVSYTGPVLQALVTTLHPQSPVRGRLCALESLSHSKLSAVIGSVECQAKEKQPGFP